MPKWKKIYTGVVDFFEEKGIEFDDRFLNSRLHRFGHFWLLVGKNFIRNRCHVRASALAYTTLLALVPLLAVGVSIFGIALVDSFNYADRLLIRIQVIEQSQVPLP